VASGEWRVASGEWRVARGERREARGEREDEESLASSPFAVCSSEWRMVSGEWEDEQPLASSPLAARYSLFTLDSPRSAGRDAPQTAWRKMRQPLEERLLGVFQPFWGRSPHFNISATVSDEQSQR
jgi:hypothetical protein